MIIFALILFRVIQQEKINYSSNLKLIKGAKRYNFDCANIESSKEYTHTNTANYDYYFQCHDKVFFSFHNCAVHDINMHCKAGLITYDGYLFHFAQVNIEFVSNQILRCSVEPKIIFCESDSDHSLTMHSNTFTNNKHRENEKNKIEVLSSFYNVNDIRNNTIVFENTDKSGRGLYVKYQRGCKLVNNFIQNANYKQDSGAVYISDLGTGEELKIENCTFKNCYGNGEHYGSIIAIKNVNYDITIKNTTFDLSENEYTYKTGPLWNKIEHYAGYLIKFEFTSDPAQIKFFGCIFSNLKSNGHNSGGLGLYLADNNQFDIIFEDSQFEHILFTNGKYGGGAFSFTNEGDQSKKSLTIKNCQFLDISSTTGSGGAIFFNTVSQTLLIENTKFEQTKTLADNQNGGSICIQLQSDQIPVSIKNCQFKDTNSGNGGAIYIEGSENSQKNVLIESCKFTNSNAFLNGNAIYIEKSNLDYFTISNCEVIDCGSDSKLYSLVFGVSNLNFINNKVIFSDKDKSCGCVELQKIGSHVYKGNLFKNAQNTNSMWNSAGINSGAEIEFYSLLLENNTFDQIHGDNQGRCFYFVIKGSSNDLSIKNNTIRNCPPGGCLIKLFFKTSKDKFIIESINFINNSVTNCYELIGPTPQIWVENLFNDQQTNNDKYHICNLELVLDSCYFEGNYNSDQGGALHYGKNKYNANARLNLKNCIFENNNAKLGGGAVTVHTYQGCQIENCVFIQNKSEEGCGSIFIETDFSCLKDDYQDKTAVVPQPDTKNLDITIINCSFESNKGKGSNAINLQNCPLSTFTVTKCDFINCGSNDFIISIQTALKQNSIENCTFNFTNDEKCKGLYSITDKIELIGNRFNNFKENVIQFQCQYVDKDVFKLIENRFSNCKNCYCVYIENSFDYSPYIKGNYFDKISGEIHFLYIKFKESVNSISLENNTFSNFIMNTQNGGIGFDISNENNAIPIHMTLNDCVFIKNTNANLGGSLYFDHHINNGNVYLKISNCYFMNNDKEENGCSIYAKIQNDITIEDSHFSENIGLKGESIFIDPDFGSNTATSSISIIGCYFEQNKGKEKSSIYIAPGKTKSLNINSCQFKNNNGGVTITDFDNTIEFKNNHFLNIFENSALIINSKSDTIPLTITECVFDSCLGITNKCFEIVACTLYFTFSNNVIQNNKGTGYDNYFGLIQWDDDIITLKLQNMSFINNSCDSLYGGGIGLQFKGIQQLTFDDCKFIGNKALQNTEKSRPVNENGKSYYNGDGGAIQIGYLCTLNNIHLLFQDCLFRNNCAHRHGGAISIQTIGIVRISRCIFEGNQANYKNEVDSSSKLLIENHFDKKDEGRGGAIYINPTYSYDDESLTCNSPTNFMSQIDIKECHFLNNNGFDGYGMYFEGDEPKSLKSVNIVGNEFIDNYNKNNHKENDKIIFGAVITTEIFILTEQQINSDNDFKYTVPDLFVKNLSFVDHYGNTPSKEFTKSDDFTYSKVFLPSKAFSQSNDFTKSNAFEETNMFSQSDHFTNSHQFTHSEQFSASENFNQLEPSLDYISSSNDNEKEVSSSYAGEIFPTDEIEIPTNNEETILTNNEETIPTNNEETIPTNNEETIPTNNEENILPSNDKGISSTTERISNSQPIYEASIKQTINQNEEIINPGSKVVEKEPEFSENKEAKKTNKMSLIIGVIIGIVVLVAIIIILTIFFVRKKKTNKDDDLTPDQEEMNFENSSVNDEFMNPLYNCNVVTDLKDPFDNNFNENSD